VAHELGSVNAPQAWRAAALRFVLLLGALSFFADFTYEGSRSTLGPYLVSLHASAAVVGTVLGLGELLAYGLRIFSGRWADATQRFWPIAIFRYVLQMISVPALALTTSWPSAAALIVLERVGKAIRNPPRDLMLSHAAKHLSGYGWAFGLHEALDQAGALCGPLMVSAVLALRGQYRIAFAALAIPAILNLTLVAVARRVYPRPQELASVASETTRDPDGALPRRFWWYLAAAALVGAGFADYPMIAYHFARTSSVPVTFIPIFYAVAMGVSGGASLLFGRLFDRFRFRILIWVTLATSLFAPLVFLGGFWLALLGAALWGVSTGVHESLIPAAVAPMVPVERRAFAFGLFTAGYGVFWFLGSSAIGVLYGHSIGATVAFCMVTQLAAVPILVFVAGFTGMGRGPPTPTTQCAI
jgi:predicted MFS family arabinose efflux permease